MDARGASRESNQGTPYSFVSGFPRMRVSRACSDHALGAVFNQVTASWGTRAVGPIP
ncbi:MAG: hypothetical protein QOC63_1133 [Mycobacterium sp.]|jgi:hypothetical protein|nr:hypothetical protein [Mycobacterium sp.]